MNQGEQIGKLERLLERIQRNAAAPRTAKGGAVLAAPAPAAPADEAAPIPLVAVAPRSAEPELSSVRVEADAPVVEVQAIAEYGAEELTEDDLVEINSQPPPAAEAPPPAAEAPPPVAEAAPPAIESVTPLSSVPPEALESVPPEAIESAPPEAAEQPPSVEAPAPRDDLDFEDEDEQPPASSKRAKVPTTMDEALAAAAAELGADEHEVPIKTPPPESGPQESAPMPAGLSAPPVPRVDDVLEADLPDAGPRPEQLGQTIDLEEARGPALELDLGRKPEPAPESVRESSEFEVALPAREAEGSYNEDLKPPPEARQELEAFARPLPAGGDVASFVHGERAFSPKSFLELLDASIDLGKS